jgi:molybdopterin-guanine dinucleotide biosynthesis protein A
MEHASGLAGLVLCGGRSGRMGVEKALIPFEGEPLVLRVARRVAVTAAPVLLASGTPGRLGDLGYAEVEDAAAGAGPLAGLVAGLAASPKPLLAVVAVDMPFANPNLLRLLADEIGDADAAVPVTDQGLEPLHAVYSMGAVAPLRSALDARRLGLQQVVAERLRARPVEEAEWRTADPSGTFAVNLNRPEDVARLAAEPPGRHASFIRGRTKEEQG